MAAVGWPILGEGMYVGLGKLLEAGEGISDAVDGEVAGVEAEPTATLVSAVEAEAEPTATLVSAVEAEAEPTATLVSAVEAEAEPHEQVAGDCKSGTSPGGRSML